KPFTLLVILCMFGALEGMTQTKYVMSPSPEFKVEGGSSLHDWSMVSPSGTGEGLFFLEGGKFKSAKSLSLSFPAETLKSGTKGLDNNAYKALNTGKYKEIKFALKQLTGIGDGFVAKGDLTIGGVTKPVSFPVKLSTVGNKLTFDGSFETKLTTFSITPPTALLGTVKTHDDIKISFKSTFHPVL
ncbi:MAG TPA: YceI family protein, partial [Algoriphagus sp.]|nr:YceI family protein [Algoriphagus sp.]